MIPTMPLDSQATHEDWLTEGVIGRRILAAIIDLLLISFLVWMAFVGGVVFGLLTFGFGFFVLSAVPAVPTLYNWLFVASPLAATPGQALLGLTVRRDEDLSRPSGGEALVWAVGFALTMMLTAGILWLAVVLLTPRKRALHDIVPGLVVVRTRALTPPPGAWNMGGGNMDGGGPFTA